MTTDTTEPQDPATPKPTSGEKLSDSQLRGLETLCAAVHAASDTDPLIKKLAWQSFAVVREVREQRAELARWEGHDAVTATLIKQAENERDRCRAALEEIKLRTVQRDLSQIAREALDGTEAS